MMGRKWTAEEKAAAAEKGKAAWQRRVEQSLAAPKVEWKTDPNTGMSTKVAAPAPVETARVKIEPPAPQARGKTVTLPDGRVFNNDPVSRTATPPPNLFTGRVKRLEVHPNKSRYPDATPEEPIPGHRLYWHHDVGIEIEKALSTGYRFVEADEIGLNDAPTSPGNNDLGTYVRRVVSDTGGPNGTAIFAFLMKKELWLAEQHDRDLERVHERQEAAIRSGTMNNQIPANVRHSPRDLEIKQDSSLYKP
jgi:hypothetical protein